MVKWEADQGRKMTASCQIRSTLIFFLLQPHFSLLPYFTVRVKRDCKQMERERSECSCIALCWSVVPFLFRGGEGEGYGKAEIYGGNGGCERRDGRRGK